MYIFALYVFYSSPIHGIFSGSDSLAVPDGPRQANDQAATTGHSKLTIKPAAITSPG